MLLVLLFAFVCLYLTLSRTLWFALPVGLLVWALLNLRPRESGIASLLIAVGVLAGSQLTFIKQRLFVHEANSDRFRLWGANFDFFKLHPWTGVGFRHTEELSGYYLMGKLHIGDVFAGHAHNNFLEMLGGTGLLGTLSWVFYSGVIFWILFKVRNRTARELTFASGLIAAWVVFQINGLTQVNFWEGKVMHQMMIAVGWSLLW
jgi:O-antigen ligase